MTNKPVIVLSICAVALGGCSSRPRNFAPVLGAAPTDPKSYEAHWLDCREIAAATSKGSGRLASAGGGAAVGAGAGVAASAAASGTYASFGAAAAAGAMVIAAVPVFGLAGAWGVSKIKKTKKERAIKTATAECMSRNGYSVEKWRVMSKREVRALDAARKMEPGPQTEPTSEASLELPAGAEPR